MSNYFEAFRHNQMKYMNYPSQVHIETVTACNCRCNFCVYPNLKRRGKQMSRSLFEKIIQDLKQIPPSHNFCVVPYKINDPFMDKYIFSKLKMINSELPSAKIIFSTNGILLNSENIARLNEISNFAFVWVSLNGYDKESYHRIMGVDAFDTVVANIHSLQAEFTDKRVIRIGRVNNNTQEDALFRQFVEREFGPQEWKAANPQGDFLGHVAKVWDVPELPCLHWFELSITSTGLVSLCCMDGVCDYPIGDINKQSVLEVYNHPNYRQLRERALSRNAVKPCNTCTFV